MKWKIMSYGHSKLSKESRKLEKEMDEKEKYSAIEAGLLNVNPQILTQNRIGFAGNNTVNTVAGGIRRNQQFNND